MISAVPAFQDNYIWIVQNSSKTDAVVVDPGDAAPVIAFLRDQQLRLTTVLITHHHADHCGGLETLLDAAFQANPNQPIDVIGPADQRINGVTRAARNGDQIACLNGELSLTVIDVPGHTSDHIAYYGQLRQAGPILFCGDTLFAGGCGRLFEGTAEQMWASLQKLAALPASTKIYCAHEYTLSNLKFAGHVFPKDPAIADRLATVIAQRERNEPTVPSQLDIELQTNPFLKCLDAKAFAAMRKQKDTFRG